MHGVQRVLSKLESSVNAGNYYEAHQMYRTLYFRLVNDEGESDDKSGLCECRINLYNVQFLY